MIEYTFCFATYIFKFLIIRIYIKEKIKVKVLRNEDFFYASLLIQIFYQG